VLVVFYICWLFLFLHLLVVLTCFPCVCTCDVLVGWFTCVDLFTS
jgi:hypothetical protein